MCSIIDQPNYPNLFFLKKNLLIFLLLKKKKGSPNPHVRKTPAGGVLAHGESIMAGVPDWLPFPPPPPSPGKKGPVPAEKGACWLGPLVR